MAQFFLIAVIVGIVIALLVSKKPWNISLPASGKYRVQDFVDFYSWWAALVNLLPLAILSVTTRIWMRPMGEHSVFKPDRLTTGFLLVVGAASLTCAIMNGPRLSQSLWDDEEYSVRRVILGSYQQKDGHPPTFKELRWSDTLWFYTKPNNHFLNSILSRLSNSTWRTLTHPQGLQFSETALRLPAYVAGVLSVGVWAFLLAQIGFPHAGMILAWLITLHPWYMRFIPQTRGYALVFLFLPLACWLGLTAVRDGRWRFWIASGTAQFALFYSWPGSAFTLVILNFGLLGFILIQGTSPPVLVGRWLVSSGLAAMVVFQLTLPCLAQLGSYLTISDAHALGSFWLKNVGALLLTGWWWHAPTSSLPSLASAPASAVSLFLTVTTVGILLGILQLIRSRSVGILLLPVFLLPGPATYLFARWKDTHLFEWYMVFIVPGLLALFAIGLCYALKPLASRHQRLTVIVAAAWILLFGIFTQPVRSIYFHRPIQLLRESVLLTRPLLDPFDQKNQAIRTVTTLSSPEVYDPNILMVKSGPALKSVLRQADLAGQPVFINQGYTSLLAEKYPDVAALIFNPDLFEKIGTLSGLEPFLTRDLYRYHSGSLPPEP